MSHLNVQIVEESTKPPRFDVRLGSKPKLKLGKKVKKSQAENKEPAAPIIPEKEPTVEPSATSIVPEEESAMEPSEMELDTALTLWTGSPEPQSSGLSSFEDDEPEKLKMIGNVSGITQLWTRL